MCNHYCSVSPYSLNGSIRVLKKYTVEAQLFSCIQYDKQKERELKQRKLSHVG